MFQALKVGKSEHFRCHLFYVQLVRLYIKSLIRDTIFVFHQISEYRKDSLNGTAFAVLVHLGLVIKVDQLDIIERPNIESYHFKTIWRIMGTMKSLYLYNNFVVWRFRDFLDINDFLPPILSAFTIVFLNSRSSWMIQEP